jgi:hypothetical protein
MKFEMSIVSENNAVGARNKFLHTIKFEKAIVYHHNEVRSDNEFDDGIKLWWLTK